MNPHTRRTALFAIAVIAIAASANALAHSYAGLYAWALHHRLAGWQAVTWPAEIDVFLAVGELALYVAYLDAWAARQRIWPWVTTLAGLAVSVAGNVGHIQPLRGHPVLLADRLTAAVSPLTAFAGLTVGLLVLRMSREHTMAGPRPGSVEHVIPLPAAPEQGNGYHPVLVPCGSVAGPPATVGEGRARQPATAATVERYAGVGLAARHEPALLKDAAVICKTAAARGERLSQQSLARALRKRGHRFPNQSLRGIALAIGLALPPGDLQADAGQRP